MVTVTASDPDGHCQDVTGTFKVLTVSDADAVVTTIPVYDCTLDKRVRRHAEAVWILKLQDDTLQTEDIQGRNVVAPEPGRRR